MNKIIAAIVALAVIGTPVLAATWHIESYTNDIDDYFDGGMTTGTVNYGIDTTGTDGYYGHEITKISKRATWTGGGYATDLTEYTCPQIAGDAMYGTATGMNMVGTSGSGTFNVNTMSNWKIMNEGGGSYPNGHFSWAGYGVELSAQGEYEMGTAIYETDGSNNHYEYYMEGAGTGKIAYGQGSFNSGTNWGDGYGSVGLNRWEYNGAEATGLGYFEEDLAGDDYLQNYKYTLPNGGAIHTEVDFNDGMSSTPIWMTGK
ncbi:MAG: hypothetical protein KAT37_02605 [Candidatus Aenigmarchaeota archaeon]|nr:hypothetical protein [Candidatus Aenigmarchaeota archaeon]